MSTLGPAPDVFGYPETRTGRIAVGLIATALGGSGLVAAMVLLVGGMMADHTIVHSSWLAIPLAALAFCGVLASLAALIAYAIERERSVFVGLAFVVGLILTHASINGI